MVHKADSFMFNKQYYKAEKLYEKIISQTDSNTFDIYYKYANSLRLQDKYTEAGKHFSSIIHLEKKCIEKPKIYFYYAETLKALGEYNNAIYYFTKYIRYGKSPSLRSQSETAIANCKLSLNTQFDSLETQIIHLPGTINTPNSEFNPVPISSSEIVFSRYMSTYTENGDEYFDIHYFSDLYTSKHNSSGWSEAKLFSKSISSNKHFSANLCFSKNKRKIYFTYCKNDDGKIGKCEIYSSERKKQKWKSPQKLCSKINMENSNNSHPYLVEMDGFDLLFFSSDREGGFGGKDIWYAKIVNGEVLEVKNAGSIINTINNEITPFYDIETGVLFFSSDKKNGFGGYDIYKSSGIYNIWDEVTNLKNINSQQDDMYYVHFRSGTIAYFSSNRTGSYYFGDSKNCCSDIYMVYRQAPKNITKLNNIEEKIIDSNIYKTINSMLPLTLYFDNDIPDPRTVKTTTEHNYQDLLKEYISEKNTYRNEYSKGLSGRNAQDAKMQIDSFFTNQIENGFIKLDLFANLIKHELESGKKITIKIKGYASPLNSSTYNLALSKRRISSIINFLLEYEDGLLKPYINNPNKDECFLNIVEEPLGDSISTGKVSDNPNDRRNSVYSINAASERKIQIIMYEYE